MLARALGKHGVSNAGVRSRPEHSKLSQMALVREGRVNRLTYFIQPLIPNPKIKVVNWRTCKKRAESKQTYSRTELDTRNH